MEDTMFYREIQDLMTILDAEEYPNLYGYLAELMNNEGVPLDTFEAANQMLHCEGHEPLPEVVRDLITDLFEDAFENGNPDAMNDLGAQYYDGDHGFEQDFGKAVKYYTIAAENGSRQAQENLGYCYYYGRNMSVDYEKAFHYFALGAFDGHLISLYKIGDMYANGYYVKKNEREAFVIYNHCMDTMTDEAADFVAGPVYLRLGNCFLYGKGVKMNPENALICYQRAENYLYTMVKNGEYMFKKSLQAAIDGQANARKILADELPGREWKFD